MNDKQITVAALIEKYNSMFEEPYYRYSFLGATYEDTIARLTKAIETNTEVVYPELEEGDLQ